MDVITRGHRLSPERAAVTFARVWDVTAVALGREAPMLNRCNLAWQGLHLCFSDRCFGLSPCQAGTVQFDSSLSSQRMITESKQIVKAIVYKARRPLRCEQKCALISESEHNLCVQPNHVLGLLALKDIKESIKSPTAPALFWAGFWRRGEALLICAGQRACGGSYCRKTMISSSGRLRDKE